MTSNKLHQLIEQSQWDHLVEALKSDSTSLMEDAKHVQDGTLPLHMIISTSTRSAPPPSSLIVSILHLNPAAAQHKGRGKNTPLHLAVSIWHHLSKSGPVDATIEAIIRAYPEALEEINSNRLTPREIMIENQSNKNSRGVHAEMLRQQIMLLLERPPACWHQLMEDEIQESQHVTRLKQIHERLTSALDRMLASEEEMKALFERLEKVDKQLEGIEGLHPDTMAIHSVQTMSNDIKEDLELTQRRLKSVEDDIKAAHAREFMAKAACRAYQSDVLRMQKKTGDTVKQLQEQVETVRSQLEVVSHTAVPSNE